MTRPFSLFDQAIVAVAAFLCFTWSYYHFLLDGRVLVDWTSRAQALGGVVLAFGGLALAVLVTLQIRTKWRENQAVIAVLFLGIAIMGILLDELKVRAFDEYRATMSAVLIGALISIAVGRPEPAPKGSHRPPDKTG